MDLFKTPVSRAESFLLFKLTFILLMSGLLFSGQAFAENDDGGLLDFIIIDGNATITGFTAGASTTTLTIPATVSTGSITYSVTSIGGLAFQQKSLKSVTIPDSVTSIGAAAFEANQLESVTISNNLGTIASRAFHTNKLASVTIPPA